VHSLDSVKSAAVYGTAVDAYLRIAANRPEEAVAKTTYNRVISNMVVRHALTATEAPWP
jgi:hypothetical protein